VRDFRPLGYMYHQSTPVGPLFHKLFVFEFCFEFAELFEFEHRYAQWATAEIQICFAYTKHLTKLVWFCAMEFRLMLWPTAHNKILATAHST
jgi:hypothetical protein